MTEPTALRHLTENFALWLADSMRVADLDIDRQRGGGRTTLAKAVGVAPSTVARWLDGLALPSPEHLQGIADAVGVNPIEMLITSGILRIDRRDVALTPNRSSDEPETAARAALQEAATVLGIPSTRTNLWIQTVKATAEPFRA
jgi:transcriptional regulator with XRE-family HTH domain